MQDLYKRRIDYMRISVTDRCNFRCRYCMPDGIRQVPMEKILTYEQITEICEAGVSLGITRFKITGGEPLVRLGCPDLVGMIRGIPGVEQITMTTNGMLLAEMLPERAGCCEYQSGYPEAGCVPVHYRERRAYGRAGGHPCGGGFRNESKDQFCAAERRQ